MQTQDIEQLLREHEALRHRMEELEDTVRALREGEVDAVVVHGKRHEVYTLERVERPYQLRTEGVPSAAATLTCEGEIIQCNPRFGELLGVPGGELVGRSLSALVASQDRPVLDRMLREARGGPIEGDLVFERADERRVVVHAGLAEQTVGAHGPCLVLTDLTEQKRFEELQAAQDALRIAGERLELAQQAGRIGCYDWDIGADEINWSATMEEQYGLAPGMFGGHYTCWRPFVHPDDLARVEQEVRRAIQERSEVVTDYRIIRSDGQTRWLSVRGRVLRGPEGQPLRLVGVSMDVTEQKAVQAERERLLALERQARAQAERAVQIRDEVLAFVAHDLRNPLLAIEMSASTMSSCSTEPERQECMTMIQRGTSEMRRLIGDLLDATRIDAGHFSVQKAPTDVGAMLHEAWRVFAPRASARAIRLECDVPADAPPALADRDRVLQLISNLLDNALKFTRAGGVVRLEARDAGEWVQIAVSDTGPGIRAQDLPRLFDAFWRAEPAKGRGAGLGLAICKGIVEAHGGTIEAESEPGRGTVIRFTLPKSRSPEGA